MTTQKCKCSCGHTEFTVSGKPQFRMICHCTICQKFNSASHADIMVYRSSQVKAPADGVVVFQTYKRPPNVQRGKCGQCDQVAIEVFDVPLFPKLTLIPAGMFLESVKLPAPKAHMFYDKRQADASDDYPKRHGFLSSQLAFFKYLWFS